MTDTDDNKTADETEEDKGSAKKKLLTAGLVLVIFGLLCVFYFLKISDVKFTYGGY